MPQMPPTGRNRNGTTPRAQGARRDPTSARSNMTASGPEQDLIAGTSRRAPPETGVKSTTATTVGTRQPREESPPLPAPAAADQAETAPTTTENRERESNWRQIRANVRKRAENQRKQPPERTPFPEVFSRRPALGPIELSELAGDGGISAETATALMAWLCKALQISTPLQQLNDGRLVLPPTLGWQLHRAWRQGPSELAKSAARCIRRSHWTTQHRRTTELFLLPLLPGAHESSCGHFIAARYNFESSAPITVWDSLSGDSTSQNGEKFLRDTFNALCTALASERKDSSYNTTQEPPQFNRERRSRLPLQTEGLDCAFFAACNVVGAIVGRTNDCTLQEARQLRALARDLLWCGGASHPSIASAQREGEQTLRQWCTAYGEGRTHTLPEPTNSPNQRQQQERSRRNSPPPEHPRHSPRQDNPPTDSGNPTRGTSPRKQNRRPRSRQRPQSSARPAQRQTTIQDWLCPTADTVSDTTTTVDRHSPTDAEPRTPTQSEERAPGPREHGSRRTSASSEEDIEPAELPTPPPPYQARAPPTPTQAQMGGRMQTQQGPGMRQSSDGTEEHRSPPAANMSGAAVAPYLTSAGEVKR